MIARKGKETVVVDSQKQHAYRGHYRIEVDGNKYKLFKDNNEIFVFNNNIFAKGGLGLKSTGDHLAFILDHFKVVRLQ